MNEKIAWNGTVVSVQPRIRLMRSFDQRSHTYLGYALGIDGIIVGRDQRFSVGIGKATQVKHLFRIGDRVSGESHPAQDPRVEPVDYYKTSKLKLVEREPELGDSPPPWHGVLPELPIYRQRGHRRLDPRTYERSCVSCIWGCRMPVEIIVDQWNPKEKRYRFETFCYGPKNCSLYKAGKARKVPGRRGMTWEEEDWVDDDATSHRADDE